MMLHLSYFAWVRDRMGCSEEEVTIDTGIKNVGDLVCWLQSRDDRSAAAFADPSRIRAAIDGAMAGFDAPLVGGQEVALFPPVTGG